MRLVPVSSLQRARSGEAVFFDLATFTNHLLIFVFTPFPLSKDILYFSRGKTRCGEP